MQAANVHPFPSPRKDPLEHWSNCRTSSTDELLKPDLGARYAASSLVNCINQLSPQALAERQLAAQNTIRQMGITFSVYSDNANIDREWPFDIIPRVIDLREWTLIERGLTQRLQALNLFIQDIYNQQRVIADRIVPASLISSSRNYQSPCVGMQPAHGVWAPVCGSDLIRDEDGTIYVLEDNLRVPSGASYMLENREVMKQVLPEVFDHCAILPIDDYTVKLRQVLCSLHEGNAPATLCVLTPGVFNSAYFEHVFLAQQLGALLVEGRDLTVDSDNCVYARTLQGLERIDIIYRRIDDDYLDPECFNKDSMLGVAGLMRSWRAGKVTIANAPGTGVADDKAVYSYVPELIRYYLDEEPLLANVPTFRCDDATERQHVLENLAELVVKPANESGGHGMLIGSASSATEQQTMRGKILADPRNYIAQPIMNLSTVPTLTANGLRPRHVDLRPFVLQGESMHVSTGGLTRVALVAGSLVVNSSQGGGSKDTWIVDTDFRH